MFKTSVINTVFNIGNKNCCRGLFVYDIVLTASSTEKINSLLHYVFKLADKNKLSFGINKCAAMVIKVLNFVHFHSFENSFSFLVCTLFLRFHVILIILILELHSAIIYHFNQLYLTYKLVIKV